jgi:hypothetical protein
MNLMENMGLTPKENKREIKLIRYDKLIANPDNFYTTNDIRELKKAILLAGGVRQNLIVQPSGDGKMDYIIISGHRRCAAVKELIQEGADIPDMLPCEIEEDQDMAGLLLITTNSTARELSAWEKVEQFERTERLYEKWKNEGKVSGKKREILAEMLGESRTGIARIQAIKNNLKPYFMTELKCGYLGMSIAYEISKLPAEDQAKLYKKWKEKESTLSLIDVYRAESEVRKEKREDGLPCDADIPEQTGNAQERREYIPLNKQTGCEILLRMLKTDGEYDTTIEYSTPEHAGKRNIGRYPNIASARMAAIGKTKDIDQCMRTALADAGLIDEGKDIWDAENFNVENLKTIPVGAVHKITIYERKEGQIVEMEVSHCHDGGWDIGYDLWDGTQGMSSGASLDNSRFDSPEEGFTKKLNLIVRIIAKNGIDYKKSRTLYNKIRRAWYHAVPDVFDNLPDFEKKWEEQDDGWKNASDEVGETENKLNEEYVTTELQGNKQTGEYYDKCLKKMNDEGFTNLEPCEQCTISTACEKCCKTCTSICNAKQDCIRDTAEMHRKKRFAATMVKKDLMSKRGYHQRIAEICHDERNEESAENEKCIVELYDILIEQMDRDIHYHNVD